MAEREIVAQSSVRRVCPDTQRYKPRLSHINHTQVYKEIKTPVVLVVEDVAKEVLKGRMKPRQISKYIVSYGNHMKAPLPIFTRS